ncbi:MAG: hypothetical protein ACYCUZ_06520 [Cuniculiplasma sp.]
MDDENSNKLKKYLKIPIIIVIIIALVSVSIFYAYVITTPRESYHNPNVSFKVSFSGNPSPAVINALGGQNVNRSASPFYSYNMSNVSVRVFGISPCLEVQGSQSTTNNSSYMELFNASHASQSGMINGSLNSLFRKIITYYFVLFSQNNGKYMIQSMDVDAQYHFVYQGKMYVYRYYNTLPFSPFSSIFLNGSFPYTFHLDMGFNMNQKPVVFNMSNSTQSSGQAGTTGGNLICTNNVSTKVTTYWGPFILNAAQLTNGYQMLAGVRSSICGGTGWFNTTGVQIYDQSSSGTIVGSNTAWGTGKNLSNVSIFNDFPVESNPIMHNVHEGNISMAVLLHFEYGIIYQTIKVLQFNGNHSEYVGSYNETTVKILNGNNDTLISEGGSSSVFYKLPFNITNNVTLYNTYINDTGYILNNFFTHNIIDKVNVSAGGGTYPFNYDLKSATFSNSSTNYIKALEESVNGTKDAGIKAFTSGKYALGSTSLGLNIAFIGLALSASTVGVGFSVAETGSILASIGLSYSAIQTASVTYTFAWQPESFSNVSLWSEILSSPNLGYTAYFYSSQAVTWDFPNGSSAEVNMPNQFINMVAQ